MLRAKLKQHLRKTDQVVEVAGSFQTRSGQLQNCSQHLLYGRFSIAAGNTDDRDVETSPPHSCKITQCPQAVFDGYAGKRVGDGVVLQPLLFGQNRGNALGGYLINIRMAVKAFATERYEQLAGSDTSGIG